MDFFFALDLGLFILSSLASWQQFRNSLKVMVNYKALAWALGLVLLSVSVIALFGLGSGTPRAHDKSKVTVTLGTAAEQSRCEPGLVPFEITNGSSFTVAEVRFTILGQVPGRSTVWVLNQGGQSFVQSDLIVDPGRFTTECVAVNWSYPANVIISARVEAVDFWVDGKAKRVS